MHLMNREMVPHDDGKSEKGVSGLEHFYPEHVEIIREREYPLLKNTTYLDHAGTTLPATSLINSFSQTLATNLFGNPHSASSASQLTSRRVDDARLKALRFFNADPEHFDLVFVANATAGIKIVGDAMRDWDGGRRGKGFWYGYHRDAHTSLTGLREVADRGGRYFVRDEEVVDWIRRLGVKDEEEISTCPTLFAYPAQSNMTGRRLPLSWCGELRRQVKKVGGRDVFSLLDAASLVSTSSLDLSDAENAPDFTVVSFYKIFGFPDLGAMIVRKESGDVFRKRRYFGGGTVGMVVNAGEPWHAKKDTSIHQQLEDGTLPFHSIIALDCAVDTHTRLYGSMENVSRHTGALCRVLYDRLSSLRHANGRLVCEMYEEDGPRYGDWSRQGPLIAFNLKDGQGNWVGKSDVEKLAAVKDIQIRSGSLCNPGGTAYYLGLTDSEMRRNYAAGVRCGNDHDIIGGKPTGELRASLGAMTSMRDIDRFIEFIDEFYVEKSISVSGQEPNISVQEHRSPSTFYVEKLCVYPIKSCGAFVVPDGIRWQIKPEGLDWDREWCLIHQGTGSALNQKRYRRMALIRPFIDLEKGLLRIFRGVADDQDFIEIPLCRNDHSLTTAAQMCQNSLKKTSMVCGDRVTVDVYTSPEISNFFSSFLDVPCTLARFPYQSLARYSKPWDSASKQRTKQENMPPERMPGAFPGLDILGSPSPSPQTTQLRLSNESPLLLVSRSSVNKLNELIKSAPNNTYRKAITADVFRANIVVAENSHTSCPVPVPGTEHPYIEDTWTAFFLTRSENRHRQKQYQFLVLGSCQRCQMVCIDQETGIRGDEPFSTLSKTRKIGGKVLFGRHVCFSGDVLEEDRDTDHSSEVSEGSEATVSSVDEGVWVKVGDVVTPVYEK